MEISNALYIFSKLRINKNTRDLLNSWNVILLTKLIEDFIFWLWKNFSKEYCFLKAINIKDSIHEFYSQSKKTDY